MYYTDRQFSYSSHRTRETAEAALEEYFADGEICEGEHPQIVKHGDRFYVMVDG